MTCLLYSTIAWVTLKWLQFSLTMQLSKNYRYLIIFYSIQNKTKVWFRSQNVMNFMSSYVTHYHTSYTTMRTTYICITIYHLTLSDLIQNPNYFGSWRGRCKTLTIWCFGEMCRVLFLQYLTSGLLPEICKCASASRFQRSRCGVQQQHETYFPHIVPDIVYDFSTTEVSTSTWYFNLVYFNILSF